MQVSKVQWSMQVSKIHTNQSKPISNFNKNSTFIDSKPTISKAKTNWLLNNGKCQRTSWIKESWNWTGLNREKEEA